MHHFAMRVGVGIFFGDEIKVLLCPLRVVGAEHERAIIDLGWIAPILAIHDGLHALLDESRLEIRVWSFLHKDFSGIVRVRVGVFVSFFGSLRELPHQIRIGGDGFGVGDDADGVRIAPARRNRVR